MKEFNYTIGGQKYEVAVGEIDGNNVSVTVNGETFAVELEPKKVKAEHVVVHAPAPAPAAKPTAAAPAAATGAATGDAVKAPLPGVIREVNVKVGDKVEAGQTLVVLEAMKMANNIEAEKAGTVTAVHVEVGQNVMEDSPLVSIA